ncbi:MAG: DUF4331 domain-containing protein [Candidatus Competibacteraceae bacterium]|nr:DUF4331 domain-containing protein [Candidatus Competibacteraceae bacterium]
MSRLFTRTGLSLALTLAVAAGAQAANHREAPLTALDQKADITDFFAFVSYDDPTKATLILDVDPFLEPSNGPNYSPFDPDIVYAIRIDNNHDAVEDLRFEFRFRTEIRAPGVFTAFVGAGGGIPAPANSPAPVAPGSPLIPPAITALDGPGSEGFNLRQRYTVTLVRGNQRTELANNLIATPTNVGPRTMPDYARLVEQGIYELGKGISVFAGTVDDPFWIDLGATFDSINLRTLPDGSGIPAVLTKAQDADDTRNFAPDDVSGFNVNAIAIEVPIELLTQDGKRHAANEPLATIGVWGTTSRPRIRTIGVKQDEIVERSLQTLVQIQRMGNPLFNELLIGTGDKDKFSMSQPRNDAQFANYALDPLLARVLNAIYTDKLPIPTPPRKDLLPLVTYMPPIAAPGTPAGPVADLLRLNTGVPATPVEKRSRLGLLAGDAAGFPNGRRVSDDVTDIALRVVVGVLAGGPFAGFPHNSLGDGVNANDMPYRESFPYLSLAHSGRDSRHVDPGEPGCAQDCPVD